ncbi:hypothetical protein CALVIDRAFT_536525 [Calocera viscosa TUFC12733]|uniref:Extracellular membrane protein CFEM domain-containing protein n=1 Tax=Calocera viscosa (strain TUFC12733) TaxID=1330018 RepID=A0A167MTW5_CALVF|nr:hypothetical protein CALVIDRAFT_536525 [Calocera viscosa TUFC12733]
MLLFLLLPLLASASALSPPRTLQQRQTLSLGVCTSLCSSASDTALVQQGEACPSSDTACFCSVAFGLSLGCLDCILVEEAITLGSLKAACAALSSTASAAGSTSTQAEKASATFPSVASSGQTALPSGTPTNGSVCSAQCSDAADVTGINNVLACSTTNYSCICSTSLALSSPCLDCFLAQESLTQAQYTTLCASQAGGTGDSTTGGAGSGSGSGTSTAGPGPSAPPGFKSGALGLRGGWAGGMLGWAAAGALAVLV